MLAQAWPACAAGGRPRLRNGRMVVMHDRGALPHKQHMHIMGIVLAAIVHR